MSRILILCDSGTILSPSVGALLSRAVPSLHGEIRTRGVFVGLAEVATCERMAHFLLQRNIAHFSPTTADVQPADLQGAQAILVCDPDALAYLNQCFTIEKPLLFLPQYYSHEIRRRFPNPMMDETTYEDYYDMLTTTVSTLLEQEKGLFTGQSATLPTSK